MKTKYTNEPIADVRVVKDFLPSPEDLILKEENVKVTISLSRSSVEYFKTVGKKNGTPYQRIIRRVLDYYTSEFVKDKTGSGRTRFRRAG